MEEKKKKNNRTNRSQAAVRLRGGSKKTQTIPDAIGLPTKHVEVESAGPVLPDHVVLWKGQATCYDISCNVLPLDLIEEDGSICAAALYSGCGGDFNPQMLASYWVTEKESAELYRAWAERRCTLSSTMLIRIQIPKSTIDSLKKEYLWYGDDWKQFVWNARKWHHGPDKFDKFWLGDTDLVIGHALARIPEPLRK